MVELIVVLAILSILSSVAVFSIIGYIDRSRFDNNEQNAQSIYQAVQTALGRKKNAGDVEDWIKNILMKKGQQDPCDTGAHPNNDKDASGNILDDCFNATAFENFDENHNSVGDSVHMRYILTYQKGGNGEGNKAITDLVGGYFYDTSILNATFTIEFDVEKTIGGDRQVHYGVNTYAVFYDEKRTDWDEKAMKESGNAVPWREYAYRSDTSLVGYYNGGNPAAVDSVYTPIVNKKMEFAELAMRNGEKLELSFSAIYDGKNVTGTGAGEGTDNYVHYTASIYDTSDDRWLADLVISEAYLTTGKPNGSQPVDYRSDLKFTPNSYGNGSVVNKNVGGKELPVVYTIDHMVDDTNAHFVRYKASVETTAMVYVNTSGHNDFDYNLLSANDLTDGKFYRFPLTISYVIRQYSETDQREYVSYSIALDAMMSRHAESKKNENDKYLNYSISRLFLDKNSPKNIRVSMTAAVDDFTDTDLAKYNYTENLPASESVNAKRAYDDPVYMAGDGRYVYKDPGKCAPEECATRDAAGYAVCNTFFGDLGYGSFGNKNDYVDVQENGKADKQQIVSITSFRHLYNMRYTVNSKFENSGEVKPIVYEIRRDLDWYRKTENGYTSEVEVYNITNNFLTGYSPAGNYRGSADLAHLKVVSWPALPEISSNQILIAKENAISTASDDKTAVIRNVQMRKNSFFGGSADKEKGDKGLGFICVNNGTICNVRFENLCLTMDATADGTDLDLPGICAAVAKMAETGEHIKEDSRPSDARSKVFNDVPVGGLIGVNNGTLGGEYDQNIIRMSNPVVVTGRVTSGEIGLYKFMTGTGGVVGKYTSTSKSSGQIRTDGYFNIVGFKLTGGVFGEVNGAVEAHLLADSTDEECKNRSVLHTAPYDAVVMSRYIVGGVVGYLNNGCFAQADIKAFTYSSDSEGVVKVESSKEMDDYAVFAHLSAESRVRQLAEASDGVGGAVGQINNHIQGKILSIGSVNEGIILTADTDKTSRYAGGAVGCIKNGSAAGMYIYAKNSGQIGTLDGTNAFGKPYAAAVGVAYIENFGADGDIYVLDTENTATGKLYCNLNNSDNTGVGLAIGAAQPKSSPSFYVRAINFGTVRGNNCGKDQTSGVGGAIGYVNNLQHSHIYAEIQSQSQIYSTGYNAGGAVGAIREKSSGNNAADLLTITAFLQSGAEITSDGTNAGGCVGTMLRQGDYSSLRTKVLGNCTISGKENVGGVAGRAQQNGGGNGAAIYLTGVAPAPVLTVHAASDKNNVGGAIGQVGISGGVYKTEIYMPKQDGTDDLILALEGKENVGGMIGRMNLADFTNSSNRFDCETPKFSVILHPASTITATNQYAGGAIGLFDDKTEDRYFKSDVEVTIKEGATAPIISGKQNVGGVFGSIKACHFDGNSNSYIYSSNAVQGNKSVGGVVGYTEITRSAGGFRTQITASNALVAQEGSAGGCIGVLGEKAEYEYVEAEFGAADGSVADITPITGNGGDLGGCIGRMNTTATIKQATTIVNTSAAIFSEVPSGKNNIGGVIGYVKDGGNVNSIRLTGDINARLILNAPGSENVGGLVGIAEVQNENKNLGIRAHLGEISLELPVSISGKRYVSGCFGIVKNSVLGKEGAATITINSIGNVTAAQTGNNHTDSGTGAFAGAVTSDSIVYCPVNVMLTDSDCISGGFNTGGVFGLVSESVLKADMSTHFAGGCIRSDKGGLGGVIGSLQGHDKPAVVKNLSAYIDAEYGTGAAGATPLCAVTDNSGTGIGSVVGQIGGWTRNNEDHRTYTIDIETISLHLGHNLVIPIGNTSVGGVVGQCESSNATIKNINVQSDGAEIHVQPPLNHTSVMDIGGIVGNMLGYLEETITVNNVDFYVSGKRYVGGWIGAMDGRFGTDSTSRTLYVTGIKKVEGSSYGIGGVIGATGCWRSTAKMYYNFDVDLKDAEIRCTSRDYGATHGTGGVIGLVGDPKGEANKTNSLSSVFYGNVNLKLNNTRITGYGNVGAIYGFLQSGSNISSSTNLTLKIDGDSWVTSESARNGDKYAGGMIGNNEAAFRARTFVEMSSSTVFRVSAPGGYAGGIIGKNANAFGRSGSDEFTIPKDNIGTIIVDGSQTGAVLGLNGSANGIVGQCGTVALAGENVDEGNGTLTYHVMNVELKGSYDKRYPRAGYVGKNNYDKDENNNYNIYNVVIDGNYETDPATIPKPEQTNTNSGSEGGEEPIEEVIDEPEEPLHSSFLEEEGEGSDTDLLNGNASSVEEAEPGKENDAEAPETGDGEEADIPEKEEPEEGEPDIVQGKETDEAVEEDQEEDFETDDSSGDNEGAEDSVA